MSSNNKNQENNTIQIIYKLNKNYNKVNIFGKIFVKNNENNCRIKYKDKEFRLRDYLEINENAHEDEITLDLIITNEIKDMSYMFFECNSLISFPDKYLLNSPDISDLSDINSELITSSFSYDEKN